MTDGDYFKGSSRSGHKRQYTENQKALQQQRKEADDFWNSGERFKLVKMNEWAVMDFYNQQHANSTDDRSRQQSGALRQSSTHGQLAFMTLTPSPEKLRNVPKQNEIFTSSFDTLCKRNEVVLKEAATVKRAKKLHLNSLYFQSQVKDVIFNDYSDPQQSPAPAEPALRNRSRSNKAAVHTSKVQFNLDRLDDNSQCDVESVRSSHLLSPAARNKSSHSLAMSVPRNQLNTPGEKRS